MYPEETLAHQDAEQIRAMGSVTTKLAAAVHKAKGEQTLESVPAHYLKDY